jgi:conjugative relaxase-like TrwC/TraI family protein
MLTLAKVTGSEAAANYYECVDDYYTEHMRAGTAWWGAGAEFLGLEGPVNGADFKRLLSGEIVEGIQMHRGGEKSRRAATDLTFSAPKSVSLQAFIGGDKRLLAAHDIAVARALDHVQERLAAYRITDGGQTRVEQSGNLIVARFRHDLSRDLDPQLHTHAVVLNATRRPDGEWRALDAESLYRCQKLLGAFYRAELAREVMLLGYDIRPTQLDGRFELSHITDEQVMAFSSRSKAIAAHLEGIEKSRATASGAEKEIASLSTRQRKGKVCRPELGMDWKFKSELLGINYAPPLNLSRVLATEDERRSEAERAMAFAIAHLTERESVVRRDALLAIALGQSKGIASFADLEAALHSAVENGVLVTDGERYTTAAAQQCEQAILDIELRGRGKLDAIVRQNWLLGTEGDTLNKGQREAVQLILTSPNRVVGVQGFAGTGKTHMLTQARDLVLVRGWQCVGIAPSAAAARELGKAGIEAQTIAAFLAREARGLDQRTLVVLDEAGMVSAVDMRSVLAHVEESGARIVLIGDTKQLKAVQAGMPFMQLQEAGMATAHMREIQRQTNAVHKEAVRHAAEGRVAESVALLKHSIIEVDYAAERYSRIARDYAILPESDRQNAVIVAGNHSAREAINSNVRNQLGVLGTGMEVAILQSKDLTEAQTRSSLSYKPGDRVQMQKKYKCIGMSRGDIGEVVSAGDGIVVLRREDGTRVDWHPANLPHATAYVVVTREIAVGDLVRITANDYSRKLINGDFATVAAVDGDTKLISLTRSNSALVTLDSSKPLHIEHGYCTTVHSAQGKTCERVLADADVSSAMANESLYYVAISRARSEVRIYTDDWELLPAAMSRSGEKSLALDVGRKRAVLEL